VRLEESEVAFYSHGSAKENSTVPERTETIQEEGSKGLGSILSSII